MATCQSTSMRTYLCLHKESRACDSHTETRQVQKPEHCFTGPPHLSKPHNTKAKAATIPGNGTNVSDDNDNDFMLKLDDQGLGNEDEDSGVSKGPTNEEVWNLIYLFYKNVKTDANGKKQCSDQYYKCYHGASNKTLKITMAMKNNTTSLTNHIKNNFPMLFCFYKALKAQGNTSPSQDEIDLAADCTAMDAEAVVKYISGLEQQSVMIIAAFQSQLDKQKELKFNVSLLLDAWSLPNQYTFLIIIAYYITNDRWLNLKARYITCDEPLSSSYHDLKFKRPFINGHDKAESNVASNRVSSVTSSQATQCKASHEDSDDEDDHHPALDDTTLHSALAALKAVNEATALRKLGGRIVPRSHASTRIPLHI
ncbi:Transposase protein [Salix suchowensis]|nr:Transposase protein [Salix suchowensis]